MADDRGRGEVNPRLEWWPVGRRPVCIQGVRQRPSVPLDSLCQRERNCVIARKSGEEAGGRSRQGLSCASMEESEGEREEGGRADESNWNGDHGERANGSRVIAREDRRRGDYLQREQTNPQGPSGIGEDVVRPEDD